MKSALEAATLSYWRAAHAWASSKRAAEVLDGEVALRLKRLGKAADPKLERLAKAARRALWRGSCERMP